MSTRYLLFILILCQTIIAYGEMNNTRESPNSDIIIEKSATTNDTLDENMMQLDSMPIIDLSQYPEVNIKDLLDVYKSMDDESDNKEALNLLDLLNKAKENYILQAKNIAIQEAQATKESIYGRYSPSFDVGYGFNNVKKDSSSINSQQLQVNANWVLFDGASREFSLLSKDSLLKAAVADKEFTQESVFLQVISWYYQYFSIRGQIIAMHQKYNSIKKNLAKIEVLYNAGLQTIEALEALRAELNTTKYQIEELNQNLKQAKLQLALLSNYDIEKLKRDELPNPQYEEKKSMNIMMLEEQANSLGYEVNVLTYWPTISIFDTYNWNFGLDKAITSDIFLSSNYPKHQNVFGVNIKWNIFSGFSTNRQKEALRLSAMRLQTNILQAKKEQENNIIIYKQALQTSLAQINSAKASLKSATIAFNSIAQKYDAQLVPYTDYLDALTKRYNAESLYIQSLNNYELQKANYIFYSGQSILSYAVKNDEVDTPNKGMK